MVVEKRKFQDKGGDSPKFPKLASKGQQRYFSSPEGNGNAGGGGGGGGGRPFNKGGQGPRPNFNKGGGNNFSGKKNFNKNFNKSPGGGGGEKQQQVAKPNEQTNQKPPQQQQQNNNIKKNKMKNKNKGKELLNQVSDESKAIMKKARKKANVKSRFMRIQSSFDSKVRTEVACKAALNLEQQLSQKSRVLTVKIQDPELTQDKARSWSAAIEGVEINRIVEPRQLLVFLKPNTNVKKEIEKLKKVNFSGGNLIIEEKVDSKDGGREEIDPFSLYVTNIPDKTSKDELKAFFPKAAKMTNVRKHNPKKGYVGKFIFIHYDTEADALEAFKANFNRTIGDRMILIRFRRVSANLDSKKETPSTPAVSTPAGAAANKSLNKTPATAKTPVVATKETPKKPQTPKATPAKPVKMEEDSDEEEDDDDEEDDEETSPPKAMTKAAALKVGKMPITNAEDAEDDEDDDSSEDDEDDGLGIKAEDDDDDDEDEEDDDEQVTSDEDDDDD